METDILREEILEIIDNTNDPEILKNILALLEKFAEEEQKTSE